MSQEKILIVEDEENIRRLYKRVMEREEYQVWTASDGQEGLKKLAEQKFDLVLSDVYMPPPDGRELVRQIRQDLPQPNVKVIYHDR